MSTHTDAQTFITKMIALAESAYDAPLASAIGERLAGTTGELTGGIVSPALSPDEPDPAAILCSVYDRLRQQPAHHKTAITHFRKALVDCMQQALLRRDEVPAIRMALGRLIAYAEVSDEAAVAGPLRWALWGQLLGPTGNLSLLHTRAAADRERWHFCLDLWLAITRRNAQGELDADHQGSVHARTLWDAFDALLRQFESDNTKEPDWEMIPWLLLLYRGVLLLQPEKEPSAEGFWRLCRLGACLSANQTGNPAAMRFPGLWHGLCWEYGRVFSASEHAHPAHYKWGLRFKQTLDALPIRQTFENLQKTDIAFIQKSLGYMKRWGQDVLAAHEDELKDTSSDTRKFKFSIQASAAQVPAPSQVPG